MEKRRKIILIIFGLVIAIFLLNLILFNILKVKTSEKAEYSFGVLSDIHLLDKTYKDNGNYTGASQCVNSLENYQRALKFFNDNGTEFVCVVGDIIAKNNSSNGTEEDDMNEWISEVSLFAQYNSNYYRNPVYATTGNHDALVTPTDNMGLGKIMTIYGDGTKTAEEVWTEIVGKNPSFVFEKNNDVFIFFIEYYWNYVNFCRDEDIEWLRMQLEKYKNKRVFLFAHLLLDDTYDVGSGSGMIMTDPPAGRSKDMKELALSYSNVIWFNGHSHYDMSYEGKEGFINPNLYQTGDSMTMVHVPACSYLRVLKEGGGHDNVDGSQGLWVDVYNDKIVIKGIDFTKGNGGTFIPKVDYEVKLP